MSLLTIVQNVADETLLFEKPQTVISNNNREARQSLSFLKKVCRELLEMHDWQVLTKEQTFVTDGSGSYPFDTTVTDGDFERVKINTEWDRTNEKKIVIVTPSEWQYLKSGLVTNTGIWRYARARGGNLIMVDDNSGDTLVFEYVSNYYAKSSGGAAKATFTADDDTSFFKESLLELGLKYYLKSEYGLPAEEDANRYYDSAEALIAQEKPLKIIEPVDNRFKTKYVVNIPDSGIGQ